MCAEVLELQLEMAEEMTTPFCGSPLWDSNLTWFTETPHFTPCFHSTVLVYAPCLVLWLLAPLDLYYYNISHARDVPWRWRITARRGHNLLLVTS